MAFVIGQVAGRTVRDADGVVIVDAGQTISKEIAEHARAVGRLGALVGAVAAAGVQDVRERWEELRRRTPEGQEEQQLDSVEDYAEARRMVGRVTGCDVSDVRGHVVIPRGTRVTEEHVRLARELRLLRALIYSASLPQPVESRDDAVERRSSADDPIPDISKRPRLPLVEMPDTPPHEPEETAD